MSKNHNPSIYVRVNKNNDTSKSQLIKLIASKELDDKELGLRYLIQIIIADSN